MLNDFLIRASYPNYFMVKKYADLGREIFNKNIEDKDNQLKGNKPGTVIYNLDDGSQHEFPPRWYDMYYLLRQHGDDRRRHLELLLREHYGDDLYDSSSQSKKQTIPELEKIRDDFRQQCIDYVKSNKLINSPDLITTLVDGEFTEKH